ncbi:hypothetical protein ACFLU5_02530 [Bacteroidota bacterium]
MRSISFFILGNIMVLLTAFLHLIGHIMGSAKATGADEQKLYDLMDNLKINILGIARTTSEILTGYSLIFAITTIFFALYNFILLKTIRTNIPLYRYILLFNILLWSLELLVFIVYMVPPPIILSSLILTLFLLAYFTLSSKRQVT